MSDELRYRLLGSVEVTTGGQAVPIERPRQRAVLAYLLLHPNQLVTTDRIVEALWGGGMAPSTARTQVQTDMSIVRRVLRAAAGTDPIATRAAGYVLTVDEGRLDTDEFAAGVKRASALAPSAPAEAVAVLREALGLWRGDALADVNAAYVEAFRAALDEQRLHAHEQLLAVELDLGRHAAVIAELLSLADAHPLHEGFAGQLMLALYRSGRPAQALQVGRTLRRALADLHGLDPGQPLRDLEQAIRRNDASLDLIGRSADPAPAVESVDPAYPRPAQLPTDIADFVGRTGDWHRLDLLIPRDGGATATATAVISAIVGTAGIGKTALAVHWGHAAAGHFPDGQLYVDMRGYSADPPLSPLAALSRFLRALGLPPERIPTDLDEAAATYRSMLAERRVLIVVDNASHVDQVRPLLPAGRGSLCLITSRSRLAGLVAVNAARPVTLDLLSHTESVALLGAILGEERLDAEPAAIAELARACGHLPLALRIAAAYLVTDPRRRVADLVAQLQADGRLSTLYIPDDPFASVQAAFDCSYRSLAPELQRAFRLLGTAPGPDISVPGAAVLAGVAGTAMTEVLSRLSAAHLTHRSGARYAMHDLVREYAAGRSLAEDGPAERAAAMTRLQNWYLRTTDTAASLVSRPPVRLELADPPAGPGLPLADAEQALAWLNDERANLLAMIHYAADTSEPRVAWLLADLLRGYLRRGMCVNDWIDAAETVIRTAGKASATERPRIEAMGHLSLGLAHQAVGKAAEATAQFHAAVEWARQARWLDAEASATGNLGVMAWRAGHHNEAATLLGRAVKLARAADAAGVEANMLGNLAILIESMGRLEESAEAFRRLIPLFQKAGNRDGEAHANSNLTAVLRMMGRWEEAIRHGNRAVELFRAIGDASQAAPLAMIGLAHCALGRFDEAAEVGRAGLEVARHAEQPYLEIDCWETLAVAYAGRGDHAAARAYADEALRVSLALDSPEMRVQAQLAAAGVHRAAGRLDEAREMATAALATATEHAFLPAVATALTILAESAWDGGDVRAATMHGTRAIDLSRELSLAPLTERATRILGSAAVFDPQQSRTRSHLRKVGP